MTAKDPHLRRMLSAFLDGPQRVDAVVGQERVPGATDGGRLPERAGRSQDAEGVVAPALGRQGVEGKTHPCDVGRRVAGDRRRPQERSEEHTSELQSLMRSSYAVFFLKKKT